MSEFIILSINILNHYVNVLPKLNKIHSIKGKRRQANMERKLKFKKKLKFLYFRPHKRLFGSEERELNGGEWSVS